MKSEGWFRLEDAEIITSGSPSNTESSPSPPPPSELSSESETVACSAPKTLLSEKNARAVVPIILTLVLGLGLFLRLWGIGWSLPDQRHPLATYHPDERINLSAAQNVDLAHLNFDTRFYNYGAFYFYLVSLSHTVGHAYGWIPKAPPPSDIPLLEAMRQAQPELAGLFLAGRIVTALMGTATILVLYLLGKRLFNRETGLLAALLYAVAPLAALHSHYLSVDVPVTLFVTLALWQSSRILDVGEKMKQGNSVSAEPNLWREVLLCGIWVGLSAATKYSAVLVVIAPAVAILLRKMKIGKQAPDSHTSILSVVQGLLTLAGVALLVFLVACPGIWLNWHAFWEGEYPGSGVRYELFEHSRSGHGLLFVNTGLGWIYHLTVTAPYSLGLPLLLLSLCGAGLALFRRTSGDWILLSFVALTFFLTGFSAVRFARYLIPLFPALCLLAARVSLEPFCTKILRRAFPIIGAFATIYTTIYAFSLVKSLTLPDPRDIAADYLEIHAPKGSTVAFSRTPWFFSPPLSPYFGAPSPVQRLKSAEETSRFQLRIPSNEWDDSVLSPAPDYVILSSFETQQEVERLHLPAPKSFMDALASGYAKRTFSPPAVLGVNRSDPNLPEDLLYSLPIVYLYEKSN